MKVKSYIAGASLPIILSACGGNGVSDTVSVEPSLNKYSTLKAGGSDTLPAVTKFGYNVNNKADWINAYAGCAASAGATGNIDVLGVSCG